MDVQASLATQNQLMIKFWSGYTIHQVSNYQNDIDGKCILINESMEILNPLKTEQMTQQYLAEWSWIDTFIYAYRLVIY